MMSLKPSASAAAEGCRIASTPRSALTARSTPLQVINILGNFVRIWSVYSLYSHLSSTGDSIVGFIFSCLVPASVIFLILQKPWKGRPLPNSQIVPTVVNGGVLALYFVLWAKGLLACRPLVALLAEYAGALLGVLSAALYGRKVNIWKKSSPTITPSIDMLSFIRYPMQPKVRTDGKGQAIHIYTYKIHRKESFFHCLHESSNNVVDLVKIGGLAAMLLAYYLLSNGWATRTNSPLYSFGSEPLEKATETTGMKEMVLPITAGILSALRRVLARRVSLKNQLKRRLHAITVASATCFLFPFAMWDTILGSTSDSIVKMQLPSWAYLSTVLFGMVLIFYVDNVAEESLHLVFSSPRHLVVSTGCIIILEILYKMDFSLPGLLLCSVILGFGILEATSLDRSKKRPLEAHEPSNGSLHNQLRISELPM
ncbi:uncharacterized protein [Triticum aestivum]|nr:uncharacterized protein LOC123052405 isoform X2 [Triticum aestivum]